VSPLPNDATAPADWRGPLRRTAPTPSRRTTWLVLAAVAGIYLLGTGGQWWPTKDSAMYLTLGRNLAAGRGYVANGQACNYYSPGLPWLIAPFYLVASEPIWLLNLAMSLAGVATLALVWASMRRWTDPTTALIVTVVTAVSYRFYLSAHAILSDQPFALLFWLAIYAWLRMRRGSWAWAVLAAAASFAAAWIRAPGLLALTALAIGLAMQLRADRTRRFTAAGVVFLAAAASVGIQYLWAKALVPDQAPVYSRHLARPDSWVLHLLFQIALGLRNTLEVLSEALIAQEFIFSVGIPALVLWGLGMWRQTRRGWWLGPAAVVLFFAALILLTGGWAVRSRFAIPVVPFLVLQVLEGLAWLVQRVALAKRAERRRAAGKAAWIFLGICVAMNFVKVGRWVAWYTPSSYLAGYPARQPEGDHHQTFQVAEILNAADAPPGPLAVTSHQATILHFLTDRRFVLLEQTAPPQTSAEDEAEAFKHVMVIPRRTAEDARQVAEQVRENLPGCVGLLVDRAEAQEPYIQELDARMARLAAEAGLLPVHQSPRYTLYLPNPARPEGL
jgi:hypothetical protein